MSMIELSRNTGNVDRKPAIPFDAIGRRATRQTPQVVNGCPCCGAKIDAARPYAEPRTRTIIYKNASISLGICPFAIMEILTLRFPAVVPRDSIISQIWPSKEPEHPEKNIQVHICTLRKAIAPLGLDIVNIYDVGYRLIPRAGA